MMVMVFPAKYCSISRVEADQTAEVPKMQNAANNAITTTRGGALLPELIFCFITNLPWLA
jgi:hypothetical protein